MWHLTIYETGAHWHRNTPIIKDEEIETEYEAYQMVRMVREDYPHCEVDLRWED